MIVRFEFQGGCKDGETVVGSDDMQSGDNPARPYLFLTDRGRIGARFEEIPRKAEFQEILDALRTRFPGPLNPKVEDLLERMATDLANRPDAIRHVYQVEQCQARPDFILIRLQFVGMELPFGRPQGGTR
jgi:hypothetical protein